MATLTFYGPDGKKYTVQGTIAGNGPLPTAATFVPGATPFDVNLKQVGGTATVTGGVAGSQGVGGLAANATAVAGSPVWVAMWDGSSVRSFATASSQPDGTTGTGLLAQAGWGFNGTSFDKVRTVGGLSTTGIGVLSSGLVAQYNSAPASLSTTNYGIVQVGNRGQVNTQLVAAGDGATPAVVGVFSDSFGGGAGLTTYSHTVLLGSTGGHWQLRDLTAGLTSGTATAAVAICPTSATAAAPSTSASIAATSSQILKGSAGNFYGVNASATVAGYVMLFDATTAPADGAVTPKKCWAVAANGTIDIRYDVPIKCSTGITLVYSSTGPYTKTASATAFLSGEFV